MSKSFDAIHDAIFTTSYVRARDRLFAAKMIDLAYSYLHSTHLRLWRKFPENRLKISYENSAPCTRI